MSRAAALVILVGACAQRPAASTAPAPPDAAPEASIASVADAAPSRVISWVEAVRRERWDDAARELDLLADPDKSQPDLLYVRARVALARGDAKSALPLLEGLETGLPLLAADIAHHRAEAKLVAGPFVEAGEYFAARATSQSHLKAAEAFERAKDIARARAMCDRVIADDHRSRLQEADARACKVRLADKGDASVLADARWVAVHAPDAPLAKDAEAALAHADARPFTAQELMARSRVLVDAGRTDEALKALERVPFAPPPKVTHLDELRAKADALYRGHGRNLEAAKVLDECASAGGPHSGEDAFHAARALSRADKDDEAIAKMTILARVYAGTTWGDEASFFVPYIHLLHGKWKDAAKGFDEYAQHYPAGVEKHDAARDRAIAHLMNQDYATARKLFEQLAADEADALSSARALSMAALAALHDGDKLHAIARWNDIARSRPLSWPALVARARLAEAGAAIPPAIDPPESSDAPTPLGVLLPPPVDVLHRVGLDADAESALRDRESIVTANAPAGRGLEALCAAYGELGRAKRRHQLTQQIPASLFASGPSARTRWAWDCAFPSPYAEEVSEREANEPLSESLAYSVMRQESSFDPDAVSSAHAIGLMQLIPDTARSVASDSHLVYEDAKLTSPAFNIALGMRHLHDLHARFHGQLPLVIAAYNAGAEAVTRWATRAPDMDMDVFVERIPYTETRVYVARVMGNLARYGYLKKGEEGVPRITLAITE